MLFLERVCNSGLCVLGTDYKSAPAKMSPSNHSQAFSRAILRYTVGLIW